MSRLGGGASGFGIFSLRRIQLKSMCFGCMFPSYVYGHRRSQTLPRKPRDGSAETADGRISSVGTHGGASPPPNATCQVHPICVLTHEPTRQLGLNIGEPSRMKMGNKAGVGCGGPRPGRSPSFGFRIDGEVVVQTPGRLASRSKLESSPS